MERILSDLRWTFDTRGTEKFLGMMLLECWQAMKKLAVLPEVKAQLDAARQGGTMKDEFGGEKVHIVREWPRFWCGRKDGNRSLSVLSADSVTRKSLCENCFSRLRKAQRNAARAPKGE